MNIRHASVHSRGGLARAASLSPEQRQEIAKRAAESRWNDEVPHATHRGELAIGEIRIPCAVLDNGQRVLSENGITLAILGTRSGASKRKKLAAGALMPLFLASDNLNPFISDELRSGPLASVAYRAGGRTVTGFEASLLPAVCEIWLKARDAGVLREQQLDKAKKAEFLMRALANIGIIALVDEATGYQEIRDRQALQAILDAYLRKELAAWAKRFPDEFYKQIFRLRKWSWKGRSVNPPQVVAKYTKDIVYARLAPQILEELERRNPRENGRRKSSHHQWLTEDVGHPALAQHLHAVIVLMRASVDWEQFKQMLNQSLPRRDDTLQLPLMLEFD